MKCRKITIREVLIDMGVAIGLATALYYAQPYLYDFVVCLNGCLDAQ